MPPNTKPIPAMHIAATILGRVGDVKYIAKPRMEAKPAGQIAIAIHPTISSIFSLSLNFVSRCM